MARRAPEPWYHPPQEEVCALCGRPVPPSERDLHHLVPKSQGGRETAVFHRICHRQLHALFSEKQLAQQFSTVEALLADDQVRGFVQWVKTKPNEFYQRTRRSSRKP
ncbi:HNH endonuclease [Caballeronia sp. ATUFL_M2_KS44]|uniref:HNH endonuclease n=1 Tax=Caballeronia sp. ATUFL_M2_KS44 TaxID=2921767 RepID=UPI002028D51C|nr:HNH endonuclease [Caballeronia sp. ATUFL_M2_KS44]